MSVTTYMQTSSTLSPPLLFVRRDNAVSSPPLSLTFSGRSSGGTTSFGHRRRTDSFQHRRRHQHRASQYNRPHRNRTTVSAYKDSYGNSVINVDEDIDHLDIIYEEESLLNDSSSSSSSTSGLTKQTAVLCLAELLMAQSDADHNEIQNYEHNDASSIKVNVAAAVRDDYDVSLIEEGDDDSWGFHVCDEEEDGFLHKAMSKSSSKRRSIFISSPPRM